MVLRDLGKRYDIDSSAEPYRRLSESISRRFRSPLVTTRASGKSTDHGGKQKVSQLWALRGVTLEIEDGEVVGIIGRNGAGKTTLLKILSRITEPTEGYAEMHGRVGSLLEVGTGFHPELTGRENVYLNGAILGMARRDIERRFDEIVSFAEVERFLDIPVKRYSSGMHVRLAFAVSAHLEPDILIVDEVLAVGDAAFQTKCLGKMSDAARGGRTVLFVSHNLAAVASLCTRGVLIEQGRVIEDGTVDAAIAKYQKGSRHRSTLKAQSFSNRTGSGAVRFESVAVHRADGSPILTPGCPLKVEMKLKTKLPIRASHLTVGVGINGLWGERLSTLLNRFDRNLESEGRIEDGTVVSCTVPRLLLRPGNYSLSLYIDVAGEVADRLVDALDLEIREGDFFGSGVMPTSTQGPLLLEQNWTYERRGTSLAHS